MKYIENYFFLTILISLAASWPGISFAASSCAKTIFVPIAQGCNLYTQYHKYENDCERCLEVSVTYRLQQSRNGCDIANLLFNTGSNPLMFQGSNYGIPTNQTTPPLDADFVSQSLGARTSQALLADYFGMGPNTNLSLQLNPQIRNNIFDIQIVSDMNCISDGLWFQINLPVVNTSWNLNTYSSSQIGTNDNLLPLQNQGVYKIELKAVSNGATPPVFTVTGDLSGTETAPQFQINLANVNITSQADYPAPGTCPSPTTPTSLYESPYAYMGSLIVKQGPICTSDGNTAGTCVLNPSTGPDVGSFTGNFPAITYLTSDPQGLNSGAIINQPLALSAPTFQSALGGFAPFGDVASRKYNLINLNMKSSSGCSNLSNFLDATCPTSMWTLDSLQMQLGYDFLNCERYHISFYAKALIPTGTDIFPAYMENAFSPLVGNGRHFELGGGISASAELWCTCDDRIVAVNFDGYVTHMFSNTQFRTFDITNASGVLLPMSRYMLLKQLEVVPGIDAADIAIGVDPVGYTGVLVAAGDVNAQNVDISVAARGEAIIDLIYKSYEWEVGGGYAFSGQAEECFGNVFCDNYVSAANVPVTSMAGAGFLYGFKGATDVSDILITVTNNPQTTINPSATEVCGGVIGVSVKTNSDIDPNATAYTYDPTTISGDRATTLNDIILGNVFPLPKPNISGLMGSQILHRIFGHIDYAWTEAKWMPTLGILGSIGFSTQSHVTAEYWDIGFRFGFIF